ncbi:TPA: hypothetical protein ACKP22_002674 [Pseudomonas putida]
MMFFSLSWSKFYKRFVPIKILGMLFTLMAIPMFGVVVIKTYFPTHPNRLEYADSIMMLCAVVLVSAQYAVIRGRRGATEWIMAILLIALLACGRGYFQPGVKWASLLGMLSAAAALACYNSRRYRQMCKRLQVIRRMRERWIADGKVTSVVQTQSAWGRPRAAKGPHSGPGNFKEDKKTIDTPSEVVTMHTSDIRNWQRHVRRSNVRTLLFLAVLLVAQIWAGHQRALERAESQARAAAKAKAAQATPVAPVRSPPRIEVTAPQGIRPETIKAIEQAIRR